METLTFSDKDLKFKLPFGMIISGPSSSGKSTLLLKFISEASDLIEPKPKSILYCFGEMSNIVPALQKSGVSVYSGVPPEDLIRKYEKPLLLILDDLLMSIDEKYLSELFTKNLIIKILLLFLLLRIYLSAKLKLLDKMLNILLLCVHLIRFYLFVI